MSWIAALVMGQALAAEPPSVPSIWEPLAEYIESDATRLRVDALLIGCGLRLQARRPDIGDAMYADGLISMLLTVHDALEPIEGVTAIQRDAAVGYALGRLHHEWYVWMQERRPVYVDAYCNDIADQRE